MTWAISPSGTSRTVFRTAATAAAFSHYNGQGTEHPCCSELDPKETSIDLAICGALIGFVGYFKIILPAGAVGEGCLEILSEGGMPWGGLQSRRYGVHSQVGARFYDPQVGGASGAPLNWKQGGMVGWGPPRSRLGRERAEGTEGHGDQQHIMEEGQGPEMPNIAACQSRLCDRNGFRTHVAS